MEKYIKQQEDVLFEIEAIVIGLLRDFLRVPNKKVEDIIELLKVIREIHKLRVEMNKDLKELSNKEPHIYG